MKEPKALTPRNKNAQEGEKKIEKYIFSLNKALGKGSYATVYLGRRIIDQLPTAVKVIDKKIFASNYNIKSVQSEIQIMKKLEPHENIVRLHDVYQTNNNMYIVTEYCEDGDLRQYIKKKKKLSEFQAIAFLKDIVNGFKYLYQHQIIHRDLKPANILLHQGKCKISDFGFAKNLQFGQNTILRSIVGTPLYMSPQILKKHSYTNKSDLWSVGLIFYEMIYGQTPWPAHSEMQLLNFIMTKSVPFPSAISDESKDFIKRCLKIKEDDRMSWEEAFEHPIIQQDISVKMKPRFMRTCFAEKENRLNFRSKSKSARKGNQSKSPVGNKALMKTPKNLKNRTTLTPDKRSNWKI